MDDLQITPAGSGDPVPPTPETNPPASAETSFDLKLDGIMTDQAPSSAISSATTPASASNPAPAATPVIALDSVPAVDSSSAPATVQPEPPSTESLVSPASTTEPSIPGLSQLIEPGTKASPVESAQVTKVDNPSALTPDAAPAAIPAMLETSAKESLPVPSAALVEAATGEPQPLPEDIAPQSNKKKMAMIAGGIFIILVAGATIVYFGKGWFFKGDVGSNDPTTGGIIELCPDGYYAPKTSIGYLPDFSKDLKTAKAQLLFTDPEKVLTAVDKANDTAAVIDANNKAMELIDSGLSGKDTSPDNTESATPSPNDGLTVIADPPVNDSSAPLPVSNDGLTTVADPPVTDPPPVVPEGCIPIPHDDLSPSGNQCELIGQLFQNPTDYKIDEVTSIMIEDWYLQCNPVETVEPEICGENQEVEATSGLCACKANYFDVSSIIPPATQIPVGAGPLPAGTINDPTYVQPNLNCWNCAKILSALEEAKATETAGAPSNNAVSLQDRISGLEALAEDNECKAPYTVEQCGENEIRDGAGGCTCMPNYKKGPNDNMCKYDCDTLISEIVALRPTGATTLDPTSAQTLSDKTATAMLNNCPIPKVEEEPCDKYSRAANEAFNTADYDAFYDNSKNFLAESCAGGSTDKCSSLLTLGVAVNKILATSTSDTVLNKYKAERKSISDQFYLEAMCNNVVQRCSEIASATAASDGTLPSPNDANFSRSLNMVITPSTIFKDDAEYAQQYCAKKEPTCEEIVRTTTLEELVKMDLTSEQRARYEACLTDSGDVAPEVNPPPADNPTPVNPPVPTPVSDLPPVAPVPSGTVTPVAPAIVSPPSSGGGSSGGSGYMPKPTPAKPAETKSVSLPEEQKTQPAAPVSNLQAQANSETLAIKEVRPVKIVRPVAPAKEAVKLPAPTPANTEPVVTEPTHSAAPSSVREVPPEITPTGPEMYIYLVGFIISQAFIFRKKLLK